MTTSCVYLWSLRSFSEHFFYRATLGNCLFHVKVTECQPPDTVKNYFTGAFQAFTRTRSSHHTRTRNSHSKVFIYLKSLKTICEEVILQWRCEKPTCEFTKKNSFTYPPSCILSSFFRNASRLLLPRRLWKCASTISFRNYKWKVVLLVIYLFNYDSSKSTFLMLNMVFDVLFKLEFFVSCNTI